MRSRNAQGRTRGLPRGALFPFPPPPPGPPPPLRKDPARRPGGARRAMESGNAEGPPGTSGEGPFFVRRRNADGPRQPSRKLPWPTHVDSPLEDGISLGSLRENLPWSTSDVSPPKHAKPLASPTVMIQLIFLHIVPKSDLIALIMATSVIYWQIYENILPKRRKERAISPLSRF